MILQTLTGPVTGPDEKNSEQNLELIRKLPNPPLVELTAEDIHVRRCRLAGDAVDGQFGCFRTHDLPKLLELTAGAPALIGHNRQSVAVARFFGGGIEEFMGHNYIVPSFYWPREHSEAEDFRVLIDSGIISEASLAFTFEKPSCSICGRDIRECEHQPGRQYGLRLCHYFYDGLGKVLEGSFVYRGAEPGTGILAEISDLRRAIKEHKKITIHVNGCTYEAMAPLVDGVAHAPAA